MLPDGAMRRDGVMYFLTDMDLSSSLAHMAIPPSAHSGYSFKRESKTLYKPDRAADAAMSASSVRGPCIASIQEGGQWSTISTSTSAAASKACEVYLSVMSYISYKERCDEMTL